MGKTLAEKLVSSHAGKSVSAGESAIARVDYAFTHDASGPLVVKKLKEIGANKLFDPKKVIIFIDHAVPSPRMEVSNDHAILREFAKSIGCIFEEAGTGICHQVVAEKYSAPGRIIVGTDSHTVMGGALGAFATGMGATDVSVAMAFGKTWLRVPETYRFIIDGKMPKGVYSKDIILHLIGILGAEGATYKSMEFEGSTIRNMEMSERLVLPNMSVEAGAKVGLIPSDLKTQAYLKQMGRMHEYIELSADADAQYEKTFEIDATKLTPMVSLPHAVDNVKSIDEIGEVKVDQVFVGSCTNARLEDLRIVASMLKGKKVAPSVRLVVTPASRKIYMDAVKDGTIETLLEAGAVITPSGCGMCFGALGGVPADGERVFSTTNRNFQGRMGNPKAFTYLGSPAMAAATALRGVITHPAEVL
ncbi:MAG: 3-isopropylmalate dehydratase large subunit [Thaumarchaeota archaeon]|nr:3-isopropylmalate dehydratase large subunit [Nitrososphaerota archaeon]